MSKSSLKQTLKDLDTKKISIRELNQDYLKRIKENENFNVFSQLNMIKEGRKYVLDFFKDEKACDLLGKEFKNIGSIPKKFLHELEECIAEIKIVHAILWRKYFKNTERSKDWGIKFMFYESNIATAVVKSAALKRIPAFPIHDGFITNKKYKIKLTQIMHDEFEKYFISLDKDPSIPAIK